MDDIVIKCLTYSLSGTAIHDIMTYTINEICTTTNQKYGLLGEARQNADNQSYFRYHAIHGFEEDSIYMRQYTKHKYIDFKQPNTLHDKVFETKDVVICNDVIKHRDGKPFPAGHPVMSNFGLFPLYKNNDIVGVLGLSGDKDFTEESIHIIKKLAKLAENLMILSLDKIALLAHKDGFISNVSHEIRTPLNGIICTIGMLKDTSMTGEQNELVTMIDHCSYQLLDIANDILDYTKITSGHFKLILAPMSLKKCIHDIIELYRPKCLGKKIDLLVKIADDVPDMIVGDNTRLTQIFLNLFSNSLKFTKKGTVTLVVTKDVHDSTLRTDTIHFSINDTGVGINKSRLHCLFNTFQAADNQLFRDSGIGLGLPITKYLVNMHNGDISIESVVDKGTQVSFTLELLKYEGNIDTDMLALHFSGKHNLIITADAVKQQNMFNIFSSIGLCTIVANNISEARMYLSGSVYTFEFIVFDVELQIEAFEIEQLKNISKIVCLCDNSYPKKKDIYELPSVSESDIRGLLNILYITGKKINSNSGKAEIIMEDTEKFKIVVAEDNPTNQIVMSKLLNKLGYYDITMVDDGFELYMELLNNTYDIAFIDLKMPIMDGISAVKKFKSQKTEKRTLLVAVTDSMSSIIRKECYDIGMNGYITKPINIDELKSMLKLVTRKKIAGTM